MRNSTQDNRPWSQILINISSSMPTSILISKYFENGMKAGLETPSDGGRHYSTSPENNKFGVWNSRGNQFVATKMKAAREYFSVEAALEFWSKNDLYRMIFGFENQELKQEYGKVLKLNGTTESSRNISCKTNEKGQ